MPQTDRLNSARDRATDEMVDLDLRIETPENVVLSYQLAGPSIRCAAYLIDLALRIVIYVGTAIALGCAGAALPGLAQGLTFLLLFFLSWCYFVVCEFFYNGKTPGKHVFGLRVIQDRGHPVTFWSVSLRNLLRAVDALPLYGAALISMVLSKRCQRLGDLAAGTVVISERRVVLPKEPIILSKIEPLSRDELGSYVPAPRTLSLIEEFLTRRHILSYARGHAIAAPLARSLAQRLAFQGDSELPERYPMAFLARVYVTFLRRDEEDDETFPTSARPTTPAESVEVAR